MLLYAILRGTLLLVLISGLYYWITWAKQSKEHTLMAILPISTLLHASIYAVFMLLNRLLIIDLDHAFINTWSQTLRIQEGITISLAAYIMLLIRKYERRLG